MGTRHLYLILTDPSFAVYISYKDGGLTLLYPLLTGEKQVVLIMGKEMMPYFPPHHPLDS